MPDQAAAAAAGGGAPQREEAQGPGIMGLLINVGMMYFLYTRFFGSSQKPAQPEPAAAFTPTPTPVPVAGPGSPMTLMGIKMGLEYPEELEDFHAMRRLEINQVRPGSDFAHPHPSAHTPPAQLPMGTVLGSAWERSQPFTLHAFVCDHADPDRLTGQLQQAAERPPPPPDMQTTEVTTFEFQGSGSFLIKAATGVASAVRWLWSVAGLADSAEAEDAAAAPSNVGDAAAPGGSLETAVKVDFSAGGCVPVWHQGGLTHDFELHNFRSRHVNLTLPSALTVGNASAFLHVWLAAEGVNPAPTAASYSRRGAVHVVHPLVKYMPKRKEVQLVSLLGSQEEGGSGDPAAPDATPHPDARDLLADPFGWGSSDTPSADPAPPTDSEDDLDAIDAEFDGLDDTPAGGTSGGARSDTDEEDEDEERPILPYWRPAGAVTTLVDFSKQKTGAFAPYVADVLQVDPHGRPPAYLPLLHVSDFWTLTADLVELNASVVEVPLHLTFTPSSLWKFSLQNQMDATWSAQADWGTHSEGESDMIKKLFLDSNPVLLGVTMLVSLLHMLFEFLAFSNDISFWRNTKSLEGLSLRTVGMNVFFQVIILLYLWDNDTSWMILGSSAVGLAIEVWKLSKAMAVGITWPQPGQGVLPTFQWETKDDAYVRSKTKEYDDMAMSHLGIIMFPVVFGYAAYSLLYDTHKSWFSWVITSLTGMVYTFGFILLTPQLFINYRLKSVAHLPWKALTYRFFNTIVDDLFAFVIEMPTMHRLSVFRDDIVFLIYLYQRWIYRVDPTRANIYGASGEDYAAAELRKAGRKRTCARAKWERADGTFGTTAPARITEAAPEAPLVQG
ncbi:CLPTM1 [Symbiodinium sp. KB8]|nr:CLPTM1 [Symbiodinium sp. KB8]